MSQALARFITDKDWCMRPPDGWKFIGSGGSREVYLGPDNAVYKVPYAPFWSEMEFDWARRLRGRRELVTWDIKIPPVTMYKVNDTIVNKMPYLPSDFTVACDSCDASGFTGEPCNCRSFGTPRPCFGRVQNVLQELGMTDIWHGNLSYHAGYVWVIDLGEYE